MDLTAGRADATALTDAAPAVLRIDPDGFEDERWPLVARFAFITSTAAALWVLIHLAARPN